MPDVLIGGVPPEDLRRIDAYAARLGLSRAEYLRRILHEDAARPGQAVIAADLRAFSACFGDLADPESHVTLGCDHAQVWSS